MTIYEYLIKEIVDPLKRGEKGLLQKMYKGEERLCASNCGAKKLLEQDRYSKRKGCKVSENLIDTNEGCVKCFCTALKNLEFKKKFISDIKGGYLMASLCLEPLDLEIEPPRKNPVYTNTKTVFKLWNDIMFTKYRPSDKSILESYNIDYLACWWKIQNLVVNIWNLGKPYSLNKNVFILSKDNKLFKLNINLNEFDMHECACADDVNWLLESIIEVENYIPDLLSKQYMDNSNSDYDSKFKSVYNMEVDALIKIQKDIKHTMIVLQKEKIYLVIDKYKVKSAFNDEIKRVKYTFIKKEDYNKDKILALDDMGYTLYQEKFERDNYYSCN